MSGAQGGGSANPSDGAAAAGPRDKPGDDDEFLEDEEFEGNRKQQVVSHLQVSHTIAVDPEDYLEPGRQSPWHNAPFKASEPPAGGGTRAGARTRACPQPAPVRARTSARTDPCGPALTCPHPCGHPRRAAPVHARPHHSAVPAPLTGSGVGQPAQAATSDLSS